LSRLECGLSSRDTPFREVAAKRGPVASTRAWCRMLPAKTPRTRPVGTKLAEEEYGRLESLAAERGLTVGEWLREDLPEIARIPPGCPLRWRPKPRRTMRSNQRYDRSYGDAPHYRSRTRPRYPRRPGKGPGGRRGDRGAGPSSRAGHSYAAAERTAHFGDPPAGEGTELHGHTRS
jgi:hypothetical protein